MPKARRKKRVPTIDKALAFIKKRGRYGATADEVEVALKLHHGQSSGTVSRLANTRRLIVASGNERQTRQGGWATVYVATPSGRPHNGPLYVRRPEAAVLASFTHRVENALRGPQTRRVLTWLRYVVTQARSGIVEADQ